MAERVPPSGLADVLLADRYRVGRRLGDGPAGHVYAADDVLLGRPVAVKVLDGLDDEVAVGRALRAARAVARARHRALLAVVDVDHGRPSFLALERVEGRSLEDVLGEGPVARARAAAWAADLLGALAALHDVGAVHRDVRADNVLVASDRALLTSAGLAEAARDPALGLRVGPEPDAGPRAAPSPEQTRGEPADARSDVAAAGVLLARLLPDAAEPALAAVLARATSADPADRQPDAAALRADVLEALPPLSPSDETDETLRLARPPRTPRPARPPRATPPGRTEARPPAPAPPAPPAPPVPPGPGAAAPPAPRPAPPGPGAGGRGRSAAAGPVARGRAGNAPSAPPPGGGTAPAAPAPGAVAPPAAAAPRGGGKVTSAAAGPGAAGPVARGGRPAAPQPPAAPGTGGAQQGPVPAERLIDTTTPHPVDAPHRPAAGRPEARGGPPRPDVTRIVPAAIAPPTPARLQGTAEVRGRGRAAPATGRPVEGEWTRADGAAQAPPAGPVAARGRSRADQVAAVVLIISVIAAVALLIALPLLQGRGRGADIAPGAATSAVPEEDASAGPADIAALQEQADREAVGTESADLVRRAALLEDLRGAERDVELVSIYGSALARRDSGGADVEVAGRLVELLRPQLSLSALLAAVDADPEAAGPGGRLFAGRLRVLLGYEGEQLREEAASLWLTAQASGASGDLDPAFSQTAMDVLESIAGEPPA